MDIHRNHPGAIGRNKSQAEPPFHRAYKACIPCRNKKAKCSITAEDYASRLPCAKCRREMRHCEFTAERHGTKKQRIESVESVEPGNSSPISLETHITSNMTPDSEAPAIVQESTTTQPTPSLAASILRTVVANGNDALNLLFEAAQQNDNETNRSESLDLAAQTLTSFNASTMADGAASRQTRLPKISFELSEIWEAYRFVKMGWFSAEEAVWFIDMFFISLAPLTPVLDDYYANHSTHYHLVTQEPLLACMLLTISSRYHTLPVIGGHSRGYLIHQRLWDHAQTLLMRIVLGLEKSSKAKTRTLGSIEALLLLTEWHPRALHAPPPNDGWDSDVMLTVKDRRDREGTSVDHPSKDRWSEDVILPAKRSDRMSWMVLGCAVSLASELGLFDDQGVDPSGDASPMDRRLRLRQRCLARLVYVYQEQLSSRLGRRSMMPHSTRHFIACADMPAAAPGLCGQRWASFMNAWTGLTNIVRSISDLLFPSASVTNTIIQNGRYISMIEHVQTLLTAWSRENSTALVPGTRLYDILMLEYQSTRMYTNSLGLQAIVSRTLAECHLRSSQATCFNLTPTDFSHLQEVIDSALAALRITMKLANEDVLRFCPAKVFLQITTASVFLLKGLGFGVSPTRLRDALEVLTRVVQALRRNNPDDLHLGARYATLLEVHLSKLQKHFVPSARPADLNSQILSQTHNEEILSGDPGGQFDFSNVDMTSIDPLENDWLTLPVDASLVPFEMDDFQGLQCLGADTLDFLWNLGT